MKIVFVSNMLNHHSLPLCRALAECCDDFKFVATVDSEGAGYQLTQDADFVIKAFDDNQKHLAEKYILEADFVIFGANSEDLLKKRMDVNKISFIYSERLFKKGFWQKYVPTTRRRLYENIVTYRNNKLYVLCASAYLPFDLKSIGFPTSKCYRWGYFPKTGIEGFDALVTKKNENTRVKIVWVGRLIKLKHPEYVVYLAERLKEDGVDFEIDIIGDGVLRSKLERMVKAYCVNECVHFLGTKKTEEVRTYMDASDILLFTSDFNEGWGAVLNEGMDSGCACVASHAPGSSGFLIQHGKNGMLFKSGDFESFYSAVKRLLDNKKMRTEISQSAYLSMKNMWNAESASKRLLKLYECLENGIETPYQDGPCSKADVLKHNWYKD